MSKFYTPEKLHARNLRVRYGITPEQYDEMLARQGSGCRLCGNGPKTQRLHVDHDHATGRVRGILCTSCNTTLGKIERIPGGLAALDAYLVG